MCTFTGPGTFWVQSRNEEAIRDWVDHAGWWCRDSEKGGHAGGQRDRAGTTSLLSRIYNLLGRSLNVLGGMIILAIVILTFLMAVLICLSSNSAPAYHH